MARIILLATYFNPADHERTFITPSPGQLPLQRNSDGASINSCALSRLRRFGRRVAVVSPEHQRLMNQYDVTFYKLDLQLERTSTDIAGTVTINARAKAGGLSTFAFELHPSFIIENISINGQSQQLFTRNGSEVTVPLRTVIPADNKISVSITYNCHSSPNLPLMFWVCPPDYTYCSSKTKISATATAS